MEDIENTFEAEASSILDKFIEDVLIDTSNSFFFDLIEKSIAKRYEKGITDINDIDTFTNTLCLFVNRKEKELPDIHTIKPQQEVYIPEM